jgi:hypothetical protein
MQRGKQILRLLSTIGDIRSYLKLVFMNLAGGFKYILLHESEYLDPTVIITTMVAKRFFYIYIPCYGNMYIIINIYTLYHYISYIRIFVTIHFYMLGGTSRIELGHAIYIANQNTYNYHVL